MLKQPELGKKISELRHAKGLTQNELAEKCNLSSRTIQRIESGAVTPRSYTVKLIFSSLDYDIYNSFGKISYGLDRTAYRFNNLSGRLINQLQELFNLKTKTMKKVTILFIILFAIFFGLTSLFSESKAKSKEKVLEIVEQSNKNLVRWFNAGEVDSIATLYAKDACILGVGCGIEAVKKNFSSQLGEYKFKEITTTSLTVSDKVAVEKGTWKVAIGAGIELNGEFLSEWHYINKKWLIVNDISTTNKD